MRMEIIEDTHYSIEDHHQEAYNVQTTSVVQLNDHAKVEVLLDAQGKEVR